MPRQVLLLISLAGALGAATAHAQSSTGVNPYTGEPMSLETLTRELETAKAQTAVLEERVKQAQLSMTLNMVPIRERAELQQLEMQARQMSQINNPPPAPPQPQVQPAPQPVQPARPPEPEIKLSSVIRSGDSLTALLDVDGRTLAVRDGDDTPFGRVTIVNELEVAVGAKRLRVNENTLSRLALSDQTLGIGSTGQRVTLPPPLPAPGQ